MVECAQFGFTRAPKQVIIQSVISQWYDGVDVPSAKVYTCTLTQQTDFDGIHLRGMCRLHFRHGWQPTTGGYSGEH